ncbi:MAG: hypothetical protein HW414_93 [Dehalococcoidia bacterium]|nr:hypothetical protein [Dehalococcoidia bacterium]
MIYDFHTHTTLSDGDLTPLEIIRRASVNRYRVIALTDHIGVASLGQVIERLKEDCALAEKHWNILALPGVELTHVPTRSINEVARKAKQLGARIVLVHGETIVEPVEKGTNLAALQCPYVDILAHPGLLTSEEATLAAQNGVFLEITARRGHCLTNGHVARLATKAGCKLLLNSDAHDEDDLLTSRLAHDITVGAGLDVKTCQQVLRMNPHLLAEKISSVF